MPRRTHASRTRGPRPLRGSVDRRHTLAGWRRRCNLRDVHVRSTANQRERISHPVSELPPGPQLPRAGLRPRLPHRHCTPPTSCRNSRHGARAEERRSVRVRLILVRSLQQLGRVLCKSKRRHQCRCNLPRYLAAAIAQIEHRARSRRTKPTRAAAPEVAWLQGARRLGAHAVRSSA